MDKAKLIAFLKEEEFIKKEKNVVVTTKKFFTFINSFFDEEVVEDEKKEEENIPFDEFFELWYDLLPSVKIPTSGKFLRNNKPDAKERLKKFFKKYKYSQNTVLTATQNWLEELIKNQYNMAQQAVFFIEKDKISSLADYCNAVLIEVEQDLTLNKNNDFTLFDPDNF